jgi:preprotein translocase subunit SecD
MAKYQISTVGMKRTSVKRRLLLLIALFLFTGAVAYPPPLNWVTGQINKVFSWNIGQVQKSYVLGLDLQGGTRLEYVADLSGVAEGDKASAMEGIRDVIERRVNTLGVSEPLVQTVHSGNEWRVTVELAGIRDINQAINLIGETPILEFKVQNLNPNPQLTPEEAQKMDEANAAADKAAQTVLDQALKVPQDFETIVRATKLPEELKAGGGDLGFIKDKPEYSEIFNAVKNDAVGEIHPGIITASNYNVVAKVEEAKDAGVEVKAFHLLISYAGAAQSSSASTKEAARAKIDTIKKQATAQNFIDLSKQYSDEPGANETGGDLGWFGTGVMVQAFEEPAMKLAVGAISEVVETPFGYHIIYKEAERPLKDVRVRAAVFARVMESDIRKADEWTNTKLTGKNLKRAQLDFDQQTGSSQVALQFDSEGTDLFAEITGQNVGKPVAIFLDGEPISMPTVSQKITGGQAVISGTFTISEAKILAQRLNSGALPVPIELIYQQSVGPSLGQASVDASLIAGLFGLLFVVIFMLVSYRLPGFLAALTLLLYVTISLAIFKLVPVTLTLSGIAGFILSMGIAVDANVLVFARLKEELHLGKGLSAALEDAFKRAWTSIRDGHVTTLISCAVLYGFTSSVIKGFALTLGIGVLLSLFTAVVATRSLLRYVSIFSWVERWQWLFVGRPKQKLESSDVMRSTF